jgi:hypothetical protein
VDHLIRKFRANRSCLHQDQLSLLKDDLNSKTLLVYVNYSFTNYFFRGVARLALILCLSIYYSFKNSFCLKRKNFHNVTIATFDFTCLIMCMTMAKMIINFNFILDLNMISGGIVLKRV